MYHGWHPTFGRRVKAMNVFSWIFRISFIACVSKTRALRATDYDYFDQLRLSQVDGHPNLLQSIEYAPKKDGDDDSENASVEISTTYDAGTGIFQSSDVVTNSRVVKVKDMLDRTYRLANLAVFMPMSTRIESSRSLVLDEMAMVLLAIHHFNNKHLSPIFSSSSPEGAHGSDDNKELQTMLADCNVRLTADFIDSESDAVKSTAALSELMERQQNLLHKPRPSAVVGSFRSSVTSPLAILSAVNNVPQITAASTSNDLDDKEVYPLLARTCTSSDGEARALVDYYFNIGLSRVAILYMTDPFGVTLQKAFASHAATKGIQVSSVPCAYDKVEEIHRAVQRLSETQHQHILVLTFESRYQDILTAAHDLGMTSGNHAWTFYGIDEKELQRQALYKPGSALFEATKGIGVINLSSQFTARVRYPEDFSARSDNDEEPEESEQRVVLDEDGGEAPRTIAAATAGVHLRAPVIYDTIIAIWTKAMHRSTTTGGTEDEGVVAEQTLEGGDFHKYLRSKIPIDDGLLLGAQTRREPMPSSVWPFYLYDAVTAMGIGMCHAEKDFFDGTHVMGRFSNITFEGASGRVAFNKKNTRRHTSVKFTMWNLIPLKDIDKEGYSRFKLTPTSYYGNGEWSEIRPFTYADGSHVRPLDLAPHTVQRDTVNRSAQISGLSIISLTMAFCLICFVWTIYNRLEPVVCAAQHSFLATICVGSFLQAAAMIPLSLTDRDIGSKGLDIACMAVPWVYGIGLSLTTGALYIKVWRLYEIFRYPELDRIVVTARDLVMWITAVAFVNALILSLWTTINPLVYSVIPDESTDIFGRHFASFGTCRPYEKGRSYSFGFSLWVVNIVALLVANWWSFKARSIETEYFESRYNAFAILTIFEALAVGGPLFHATTDTPDAMYVVALGIISLTSLGTTALVFAPKMYAIFQDRKRAREEERKRRFSLFRERAAKSQEMEHLDGTSSTEHEHPVEMSGICAGEGRDVQSHQQQEEKQAYSDGASDRDSSRFLDAGIRVTHHPKTDESSELLKTFSERCLGRNASASARRVG